MCWSPLHMGKNAIALRFTRCDLAHFFQAAACGQRTVTAPQPGTPVCYQLSCRRPGSSMPAPPRRPPSTHTPCIPLPPPLLPVVSTCGLGWE